ncbi:MAG: lactate utilization protein [Desulfuromonadales bacterium]|nr:lactate utilization protein [Desulfuromonadales bacterium]
MYDLFKAKAEGVGAEVHRFRSKNDALDFVVTFLNREGVADAPKAYALWAEGPFLNGVDRVLLQGKAPGLKFEVSRELAADSLVGISEVGYALTDTGSLVTDQTAIEQRLVSTLSTIHIALIGTDRILDGKPAVFKKINPANSRYIAFITGPSRTADIERVLTIGVHGPKRLVIVFVDELEGAHS